MRLILAAAALAILGCEGRAVDPPPPKEIAGVKLTGRVIDQADLLPPATEQRIAAELESLERKTSDQVVVITLNSLNGASIEQVGYALGNGWGIGREDLDNGVLLLVAPEERKVRVEVGLGLEGLLSDARAAEIVREMLPQFRAGQMAAGVETGVREVVTLLRSDPVRPRYSEQRKAA